GVPFIKGKLDRLAIHSFAVSAGTVTVPYCLERTMKSGVDGFIKQLQQMLARHVSGKRSAIDDIPGHTHRTVSVIGAKEMQVPVVPATGVAVGKGDTVGGIVKVKV